MFDMMFYKFEKQDLKQNEDDILYIIIHILTFFLCLTLLVPKKK